MKSTFLFVHFVFFFINVIIFVSLFRTNLFNNNTKENDNRKLFEWSVEPPDVIQSINAHRDCEFNGRPICCSLLHRNSYESQSQLQHQHTEAQHRHMQLQAIATASILNCTTEKKYIPSAYETRHREKVDELGEITDFQQRAAALYEFIVEDIPHSNRWLERVHIRMQSIDGDISPTDDDYEYLSRFIVTRTCQYIHHSNSSNDGNHHVISTQWEEWIEPLTAHGRHPFAFVDCLPPPTPISPYLKRLRRRAVNMTFDSKLTGTDYILLQSGDAFHNQTIAHIPLMIKNRQQMNTGDISSRQLQQHHEQMNIREHSPLLHKKIRSHPITKELSMPSRNYLFDAGTYTFDSSLSWFACAYLQRNIDFDDAYGWEYSLLEPQAFWKNVPPSYISRYHFFNIPVSDDANNPLDIIKGIAHPDDFVSFKLDIDTPELEIPMALHLLQSDSGLQQLIDEFFFELHFRCEFMMFCGWGDQMPEEYKGLRLDRVNALKLFRELREAGVRAHFWP